MDLASNTIVKGLASLRCALASRLAGLQHDGQTWYGFGDVHGCRATRVQDRPGIEDSLGQCVACWCWWQWADCACA
eukprot:237342-Amphidinium_carterae.1